MPIKPLNPDLLLAPDPSTPSNPNQESGVQSAPTQRRLGIYFRYGNQEPVAPQIDSQIDIAKPIINRYAEYLGEQTNINNIPVLGLPVVEAGFPKQDQDLQEKHTNNFPQEANSQFINYPTITYEDAINTPDKLGINYKTNDAGGPRNFRINQYEQNINLEGATLHGANIDKTLLDSRGHNQANKFVTEDIANNKADGRITLGSFFYGNVADLSNRANYAKKSYVVPEAPTPAPPQMTIEQMKNIGLNLMFEAVQGPAGLDFAISGSNLSSTIEAEGRMAVPSPQRLGKRVSLDRFTPAYQIKKLVGVQKPNNPNFIDNTDDIQTYGSFNNVYSQFDSLISAGQIVLVVALILAFVLLLNGIVGIVYRFNPKDESATFSDLDSGERQRLLGASVLQNSGVYPLSEVDAGDFFSLFLGTNGMFNYTRHSAEQSLNAGIEEFFGFSFTSAIPSVGAAEGAGQQATNTLVKVFTESGRLNVILRELLRSGITLVEDAQGNFSGGVSVANIGNLIRKIRDLKIVRFINVLMSMGDKIRFEADIQNAIQQNPNKATLSGSNGSYVDSLSDARSNFIAKSRTSDVDKGLIWSNKKAGMLGLPLAGFVNSGRHQIGSGSDATTRTNWEGVINYLYEENAPSMLFETAPRQILANGVSTTDTGPFISNQQQQDAIRNGRYSPEVVQQVEAELEADFMPFYIHDLRTNEILSFHAFLEDANEDFSVEFSAQEGYGRMDKVQIYKGATRNINVSFKMVAMNPEDHDIMWYKINRLAMMIYPQWTQGRKVEVGNLKFVQPFSQIPGASPVIRLRLGDLYKSNYSKMAVARLFGISTLPDFNVYGSPPNGPPPPRTEQQESAHAGAPAAGNQPPPRTPPSARAIFLNRLDARARITADNIRNAFAEGDKIVLDAQRFPNGGNRPKYRVNGGTNLPNSTGARVIATVQSIAENGNNIQVIPNKFVYSTGNDPNNFNPENSPNEGIVSIDGAGGPISLGLQQLNDGRLLDKARTITLLLRAATNTQTQERGPAAIPQDAEIRSLSPDLFFSETNNPIMKAFKSSGGKGLAGVITSFKIDYGDAKGNWGTDGTNLLRAPMFVTVQLGMAVIHDITPGLDANGIMMAPIWPVGKTSNYFVNNGDSNTDSTAKTERTANDRSYFEVDQPNPLYYNRKA